MTSQGLVTHEECGEVRKGEESGVAAAFLPWPNLLFHPLKWGI